MTRRLAFLVATFCVTAAACVVTSPATRKVALAIALISAGSLLAACQQQTQVELALAAEVIGADAIFSGSTNLPDGAVIEIRMTGPDGLGDRRVLATVKSGQFEAKLDTRGLSAGEALGMAWFYVGDHQPPMIVDEFGMEGEHLADAEVTSDGIRYVEATTVVPL